MPKIKQLCAFHFLWAAPSSIIMASSSSVLQWHHIRHNTVFTLRHTISVTVASATTL